MARGEGTEEFGMHHSGFFIFLYAIIDYFIEITLRESIDRYYTTLCMGIEAD
jgi:hypothetical protein